MDLLPITVLYYIYKPDVLNWPTCAGKISLKLEHLNHANNLAQGQAHDAQVDVKAVVELAKLLSKKKKMWNYLSACFHKATDSERIKKIPVAFSSAAGNHRKALMTGTRFGSEFGFQVPVLGIGESIPYSNQTLWLRLDIPELSDTIDENIVHKTQIIRKKTGEPEIVLPPHERYWKKLSLRRCSIVEENIEWLQANTSIFQKIIEYYVNFRYPVIPDLDVDAALYDIGFLSHGEQAFCDKFHNALIDEKIEIVNQFKRPELLELAVRTLCRNYLKKMPEILLEYYKRYMKRINPLNGEKAPVDYRGDFRTTPAGALKEIEKLENEAEQNSHKLKLLNDLADYIKLTFPAGSNRL